MEYRVLQPGSGVRRVLYRARVIRDRGSVPDRLVGVTLDVTGVRELEKKWERAPSLQLIALAEAAERERISREHHDRVAHHMGVAHQSLEFYAALSESASKCAAEKLELARETTRRALDQTCALYAELKRRQERRSRAAWRAAFGALLAESYMPDGVEVNLSFSGDQSSIHKPVKMQVCLAMREAVGNALRHSGCLCLGISL